MNISLYFSGQEQALSYNTRSGGLHRLHQRIFCECEYEWLNGILMYCEKFLNKYFISAYF